MVCESGHYPGIDGTLERTYPTAAPGASVIKMKMRMTMTKLTIKDKKLIILREALLKQKKLLSCIIVSIILRSGPF